MSLSPTEPEQDPEVDDGWEIIQDNWWCTPLSGTGVSWSYPRSERIIGRAGGRRTSGYAKPMYYHRTLFCPQPQVAEEEDEVNGDMDLNPTLLGVKCAVRVLEDYEIDVGFDVCCPPDDGYERWRPSLMARLDEEESQFSQKQWHDLVQDLLHSPIALSSASTSTPSTPSFIDLTDSERSLDSMPSTPQAKNEDDIILNDRDSISLLPESPRTLNISAPSIVPSPSKAQTSLRSPGSSPPSPTPASITNFTFPTLNLPSPPVTLHMDDFSDVKSTSSKSALLPPSSGGRRRKSKTREIVDRLKAEPGRKADVGFEFNLDADAQQDDGWIRHGGFMSLSDEKQAKARRSRELFLALRQRQALQSESVSTCRNDDGNTSRSNVSSLMNGFQISDALSKSPSPSTSDDGWISGPAKSPIRTTKLANDSVPKGHPSVRPLVYPVFPVPVSYYSFPPGYATAYMQMATVYQMPVVSFPSAPGESISGSIRHRW